MTGKPEQITGSASGWRSTPRRRSYVEKEAEKFYGSDDK